MGVDVDLDDPFEFDGTYNNKNNNNNSNVFDWFFYEIKFLKPLHGSNDKICGTGDINQSYRRTRVFEGLLTKLLVIFQVCLMLCMHVEKDYTNEFPKFFINRMEAHSKLCNFWREDLQFLHSKHSRS